MEGRLALLIVLAISLALLAYTLLNRWLPSPVFVWTLLIALIVMLAMIIARIWTVPLTSRLRALESGTASFVDSDYSISLSEKGPPELVPIIRSYNQIGTLLREERQTLHQRELLLDTVIQASPIAMLLLDSRQRVIYSNSAARKMLYQGRRMEGMDWDSVLETLDASVARGLRQNQGGVFSIESTDGDPESCLAVIKEFRLNAKPHRLYMLQRLTRELNRQEVATWKKVIRIISHELNNSVAPITSLVHSGRILAERGDRDRLIRALDSVAERARHLAGFIGHYANFARLPEPEQAAHDWAAFLSPLQQSHGFRLLEPLPQLPGWFDATLMEQVLINLIKNALEAGSSIDDVELRCINLEQSQLLEVRDRGTGMNEVELKQALAPFYSTKKSGSGIGLALCREIIEAHGGDINLRNRSAGGLSVQMTLPLREQLD